MTATSTRPAASTNERKRRRRTAVRISLAGVALLGIAAAATSAAWTDQAWFSATASAGSIELQGSADGTTWVDADTAGAAVIVLPTTAFELLVPDATRTATIHIKNTSDVPLSVTEAVTTTGAVFGGTPAATVTTDFTAGTELAPDDEADIVVTVTVPTAWASTQQGTTGAITLTYTGSTL